LLGWFRFTVPESTADEVIAQVGGEWIKDKKGFLGYRQGRYNAIDDRDLTKAAQKVHKYLQENTPGTLAETMADYLLRK
jgi:hypothetical protein